MPSPRSTVLLALAIGTLAGAHIPVLGADALRFEETFLNTSGKNRNIDVSDYEWASFVGGKGELNRANTSIGATAGNPSDTPGFLAISNAAGTSRLLVRNIAPAIDIHGSTLAFRFGASHAQAQVRVVIRVSGRWYASDTVFTSPLAIPNGAAFADAPESAVRKQYVFSPEGAAWRALILEPGVEMTLSDKRLAAPLPVGPASAIGFILTNHHGSWGVSAFLDTLQIIAPTR